MSDLDSIILKKYLKVINNTIKLMKMIVFKQSKVQQDLSTSAKAADEVIPNANASLEGTNITDAAGAAADNRSVAAADEIEMIVANANKAAAKAAEKVKLMNIKLKEAIEIRDVLTKKLSKDRETQQEAIKAGRILTLNQISQAIQPQTIWPIRSTKNMQTDLSPLKEQTKQASIELLRITRGIEAAQTQLKNIEGLIKTVLIATEEANIESVISKAALTAAVTAKRHNKSVAEVRNAVDIAKKEATEAAKKPHKTQINGA